MRKTILTTALLIASSPSFAEVDPDSPAVMSNFSYDYLEARIGASPVTFGAEMSRSIHPNAHAILRADSEFEGDYDTAAGFGFHAPINNWADFTGEMLLRLVDTGNEARHSYKRGSSTGMELNIGIRQWIGPQLEVGEKVDTPRSTVKMNGLALRMLASILQNYSLSVQKHVSMTSMVTN